LAPDKTSRTLKSAKLARFRACACAHWFLVKHSLKLSIGVVVPMELAGVATAIPGLRFSSPFRYRCHNWAGTLSMVRLIGILLPLMRAARLNLIKRCGLE
jgi:hypothetical protein